MFLNRVALKKICMGFFVLSIIACSAEKKHVSEPDNSALIQDQNEAYLPELILAPESSISNSAINSAANASVTERPAHSASLINTGAMLHSLPSNGVFAAELDPANYQKINQNVMEAMGMAPYYVAFLAGEKFYKEGDFDGAISEYNRTISLKTDYADAFISRGNAQRKKGDINRAIEDYSRALALKRDFADVYNYRGFMYAKRGDVRRAIEDYTQAIRYKTDYADAYFNRAYAHAELGNWDLCIADYTQVIKLEPLNWVAYHQRGNAWYSKGDKAKAAEDYGTAERLNNMR